MGRDEHSVTATERVILHQRKKKKDYPSLLSLYQEEVKAGAKGCLCTHVHSSTVHKSQGGTDQESDDRMGKHSIVCLQWNQI